MALLRALRLSMNGKPGTLFEVKGNRIKQLTAGKKPIAEVVTKAQLEAEAQAKADAEAEAQAEADAEEFGTETETKPAAKAKKGKK